MCIQRTYGVLIDGGWLVFDINTKRGLQKWDGVMVQEDEEVFLLTRGVYDDSLDRAFTQITGFIREENGRYERFSQTAYNLLLSVDEVMAVVREAGFSEVYSASPDDLKTPLCDPESASRLFFVCRK